MDYLDKDLKVVKDAQKKWRTTIIYEKIQIFRKIIYFLQEYENGKYSEDICGNLTSYINHLYKQQTVVFENDYQIVSYKEPHGIFHLLFSEDNLLTPVMLLKILKTIFDGNAVVITEDNIYSKAIGKLIIELSKILPKNLLIFSHKSLEILHYVKGVQCINTSTMLIPNNESFTFTKNVWQNIGATFN